MEGGTDSSLDHDRRHGARHARDATLVLRPVDQRTLVYTGLTRDGTFLIENGKIARSIKNFRFNESPLFMLNNLEAIGPAVRTAGGGSLVMPADQGAGLQLHQPVGRGVGRRPTCRRSVAPCAADAVHHGQMR